jgi:hypothetical protein
LLIDPEQRISTEIDFSGGWIQRRPAGTASRSDRARSATAFVCLTRDPADAGGFFLCLILDAPRTNWLRRLALG